MKKKLYYNYCVEILKHNGDLWFVARFSSKSLAEFYKAAYLRGRVGLTLAPAFGREYVKYFSFKPEFK